MLFSYSKTYCAVPHWRAGDHSVEIAYVSLTADRFDSDKQVLFKSAVLFVSCSSQIPAFFVSPLTWIKRIQLSFGQSLLSWLVWWDARQWLDYSCSEIRVQHLRHLVTRQFKRPYLFLQLAVLAAKLAAAVADLLKYGVLKWLVLRDLSPFIVCYFSWLDCSTPLGSYWISASFLVESIGKLYFFAIFLSKWPLQRCFRAYAKLASLLIKHGIFETTQFAKYFVLHLYFILAFDQDWLDFGQQWFLKWWVQPRRILYT